ncbi:hypothetical protein SAMN02745903_01657 [Pseudomonas sp. URMO17WK12:I5]|nr:hypothetical protein H040_01721 [Pseudomonas sp. URMO17WK12:I7]SMF13817.1 hypothetical protein SAMN02745903_01657 [Pseudomonas sp. URMO17WK12:I5]
MAQNTFNDNSTGDVVITPGSSGSSGGGGDSSALVAAVASVVALAVPADVAGKSGRELVLLRWPGRRPNSKHARPRLRLQTPKLKRLLIDSEWMPTARLEKVGACSLTPTSQAWLRV